MNITLQTKPEVDSGEIDGLVTRLKQSLPGLMLLRKGAYNTFEAVFDNIPTASADKIASHDPSLVDELKVIERRLDNKPPLYFIRLSREQMKRVLNYEN